MYIRCFIISLSLFFSCTLCAQQANKSDLQQKAEAADESKNIASARFFYIRAFEDYASKGQMSQAVQCGAKGASLYYKENYYKEAFDLLRRIDDQINANTSQKDKAALHYFTTKERLQMYMKLRKSESAKDQLNTMENYANASSDEDVKNDLLYTKAIYYYTFGQTAQGNAMFKEMSAKMTSTKSYDKLDEVYKTLIANARKSGNANMVALSYSNYIAWKDSASQMKHAEEVGALKKKISDHEATIADKDSSLTSRQLIIIGLCILAAALAAALVVGAIVLMRFILLSRKQKKTIKLANETNALKAKFISNISSQLDPTLRKLDNRQPEVKSLLEFSDHIQQLSQLENSMDEEVETEDTMIPQFCEGLVNQIRDKVKRDVRLTVDVPKMSANINQEYVSHILLHLLRNAAEFTPEGGHITLDFKKRGAHKIQFLVTDTGPGIEEEKREALFKPFVEIRDLTEGDGLGLPICKQMALKMKGDLELDTAYTKGTRFMLDLQA